MEGQVMFNDPGHWFPNAVFTNVFGILVILVFLSDYLIPRQKNRSAQRPVQHKDRGSFLLIYISTLLGFAAGIVLRYQNKGILTGVFQYIGLLVMLTGSLFRSWSLVSLGTFFSRIVQIETEHRIIKTGPYRWIRHPAYTGMIVTNVGVIMALGTWLGALIVLVLMLVSTLYRIRVEEALLLETFGNEYRDYMSQTWRLFPGW
jgi:protein-S-isoprenylcysteine O-methyltransferase Ste14